MYLYVIVEWYIYIIRGVVVLIKKKKNKVFIFGFEK